MSSDLYTIRCYFYSARGLVKVPGLDGAVSITRSLASPPEIPGLPQMDGIDYAPEARTYDITPRNQGRREMTRCEREMMRVWLEFVQRGEA